jgi:hypothetical protein
MERETLGDFIRRSYLEKIGEMPAICAQDFEDAIYLGVQWQKDQAEIEAAEKLAGVDRVEVIDFSKGGRAYSNSNAKDVEVEFQDAGKTMKIFVR